MYKTKICFAAALMMGSAAVGMAQESYVTSIDSTLVFNLEESIVTASKAPANAPFAISEIDSRSLSEFTTRPQELPYLFARTPGVLAWGENGLGTGTSYLRIRGAGDSRINVTLDGVPLNSPEDQCVFWANMNGYAALLGGVQIQRGVGSSSNGDGAFGGTVALTTKVPSLTPSAYFSTSYGSFNTAKANVGFSTGLLADAVILDGNISASRTDGYLHGTGGNGGNWMFGVHYLIAPDMILRYRNIGNVEHTGQAWNGVVTGDNDNSLFDGTYGESTGIRTYADMYRVGLGRFNNLYERLTWNKDENGQYLTERYQMNDGSYWNRTTDNFTQDHNILSFAWEISDAWKLNASAHYTYGYGYYDEFRPDNKLKKFGLQDLWNAKGKTVSDFVRQKGLSQHTYGVLANALYTSDRLDLQFGLNAQNFNANHFGFLTYISNQDVANALASIQSVNKPEGLPLSQYYNSDAVKTDLSGFAKASYRITPSLQAFVDLQYRYVHFATWGINDKFVNAPEGGKAGPWMNHELNVDKTYNFFNPKAGLSYNKGGHSAFASAAISNREPERNNFTDNGAYPAPLPERLYDYELGYSYNGRVFEAGLTLYYMNYRNQFVQTGMVSDIGEALTTNIESSYRAGIELTAALTPVKWFTLDGNVALSRNRILDFTEYAEDWDNYETGVAEFQYENSTLAFSPSVIANINATARLGRGVRAVWHTSYVSRQYLDNTQNLDRSLPQYSLSDLSINYSFEPSCRLIRLVDCGLSVGNVFNAHVAQSAWVYSAISESYGHPNENRYTQIGFIPVAGTTVMGSISLKF